VPSQFLKVDFRKKYPTSWNAFQSFLQARRELRTFIHDPGKVGQKDRRLGAILDETKLRRVLEKMLDENEFLSPYGIRALSRFHAEHPYVFKGGRTGVPRRLRAERIGHRHVRRQLELARAHLDAGQRTDSFARCFSTMLITATTSRSNVRLARVVR
jgi:hypothetical protein